MGAPSGWPLAQSRPLVATRSRSALWSPQQPRPAPVAPVSPVAAVAPAAALVAGLLVTYLAGERGKTRAAVGFLCSIAGSILVIHPAGIIGLMVTLDMSVAEAFRIDVLYWVGDLLKTTMVALIAAEVHRAFPRLLRARGARPARS